jgi:hypothetical protein
MGLRPIHLKIHWKPQRFKSRKHIQQPVFSAEGLIFQSDDWHWRQGQDKCTNQTAGIPDSADMELRDVLRPDLESDIFFLSGIL